MKKTLAVLLTITMLFSLTACSVNQDQSSESEAIGTSEPSGTNAKRAADGTSAAAGNYRGSKIGIFCSPVSWGEENYRTVEAYIAKYGENRFILNTIPDDCDVQTMISLCSSMAQDPECGVIIINEAVPGSVAAMNAAKAINPNIMIFAINYLEEPIEVAAVADLACGKSYSDFAYSVIDAAHEKGLEVVSLAAAADTLGTTRNIERIAACKERCEEYGIEFIMTTLPNETDSNSRAALEQAAKEDVYNKINEYGEKVGFFPSTSYAYVPQLTAIVDAGKGYMLTLADPGPFTSAYSDVFGISAPEGKKLDLDWTNTAISEAIDKLGLTGHFGNWKFSFLSGFMSASIEFSMDYMDGNVERDDIQTWMDHFASVNHLSEGDFGWSTYSRNGEEYDNLALVTGKILWYGENLK